MMDPTDPARLPGVWLLAMADRLFDNAVRAAIVHQTIADLRAEWIDATSPFGRVRARWLGTVAFWRLVCIAPFVFRRGTREASRPFWRLDMTLSARVRLVMVLFVLGLIGGWTYAAFRPPRYQAVAVIQGVPSQIPAAVEADLGVANATGIEDRLPRLTQRVLSRAKLESIIEEHNLYLKERKTDLMEEITDRMKKDIVILPLRVDAFTVSYTSTDPQAAFKVTERLASLLRDEYLLDRESTAANTAQFLEAQVVEFKTRLADLTANLSGATITRPRQLEIEVMESFYKSLLTKRAQATISSNLESQEIGQQFRVIYPPRLPERPMGPSRTQFALAGGGIGVALAALISLVLAAWRMRRSRGKRLAEATS